MKPPIVTTYIMLLLGVVVLSCNKTTVAPDNVNNWDTTLQLPTAPDVRDKCIGVYLLQVTHRVVQQTKTIVDTVYKNKEYTFFYKSTDTVYYQRNGVAWYQLPAIRVSVRDEHGITDTTKYKLWGVRERKVNKETINEVIIDKYASGQDTSIHSGGFVVSNAKFYNFDSVYIDHSFTSQQYNYIYNYKGRKIK